MNQSNNTSLDYLSVEPFKNKNVCPISNNSDICTPPPISVLLCFRVLNKRRRIHHNGLAIANILKKIIDRS